MGAGADGNDAVEAAAYADLVVAWARAEVLAAVARMESTIDAGGGTTLSAASEGVQLYV